jgi:Arc/MetJ family transcription regulator
MLFLMRRGDVMRTTVTIDDKLLAEAREYTGIDETPKLIRKALESLVQREAARRIMRLGGSEPGLEYIPRRRPPDFINHPISQGRKKAAE